MNNKKKTLTKKEIIAIVALIIAFIAGTFIVINNFNKITNLSCNVNIETDEGTRKDTVKLKFENDILIDYSSTTTVEHFGSFNEIAPNYYPGLVEMLNENNGIESNLKVDNNKYIITTNIDIREVNNNTLVIIEGPLKDKNLSREDIKKEYEKNKYECK